MDVLVGGMAVNVSVGGMLVEVEVAGVGGEADGAGSLSVPAGVHDIMTATSRLKVNPCLKLIAPLYPIKNPPGGGASASAAT